jgi:xanthine dehydrogenase accessory factor
MTPWLEALRAAEAAGRAAVLVTVVRTDGSTPREAGAKMVVTSDGLHGSIGGGHLELEAIHEARHLLETPGAPPSPVLRELALGPSLGQCCGGRTALLFEPLLPVGWTVAVFGAGHVGRALVGILATLPCRVRWIDSREEQFPAELAPSVTRVVTDAPEDEVAALPADADVVVMTHSHAIDQQVVEAALKRTDLGFLGLIGSKTKRAQFLRRFAQRGRDEAELSRLTCPIGLPGIHGKAPGVVAVAVAAQLLARRPAEAAGTGPARSGGPGAASALPVDQGGEDAP